MAMYQNILVPVDGSTTSNLAIQEAARIAQHQEQNAHLELVHVMSDIHLIDANSYINYEEMKEIETSIGKKILAQAQTLARQAGVTAEIKLLEAGGERIANVLGAEARRWPADLIVIGTHGRSGFSRVLFGSVAEGVIRTAHVPVLLIRGA
jgi:nucleotide-binding universal stress UspA family protein